MNWPEWRVGLWGGGLYEDRATTYTHVHSFCDVHIGLADQIHFRGAQITASMVITCGLPPTCDSRGATEYPVNSVLGSELKAEAWEGPISRMRGRWGTLGHFQAVSSNKKMSDHWLRVRSVW